jgi:hypothetical protein
VVFLRQASVPYIVTDTILFSLHLHAFFSNILFKVITKSHRQLKESQSIYSPPRRLGQSASTLATLPLGWHAIPDEDPPTGYILEINEPNYTGFG